MMSPSAAPVLQRKAIDQAIQTCGTVIHFEERCTAKNNFETNKFTFSLSLHKTAVCVEQSVSSSATVEDSTCPRELVQRYAFSLIFLFFLSPEAESNACAGRETQIKTSNPKLKLAKPSDSLVWLTWGNRLRMLTRHRNWCWNCAIDKHKTHTVSGQTGGGGGVKRFYTSRIARHVEEENVQHGITRDPPPPPHIETILVFVSRRSSIFFCLKALGKIWKWHPFVRMRSGGHRWESKI